MSAVRGDERRVSKAKRETSESDSEAEAITAGRSSRRRLLRTAAGGAAVFGGVALAPGLSGKPARAQDGPVLRGTWRAQLTRDNPPPGFAPTQFLFTFTADGEVIGSGPPILVENGVATLFGAQLGQWQETEPNTFVFSFSTSGYGMDGTLRYLVNSLMNMTMAADERSWKGTYVRQDVATDNTVIRSVTGAAVAQPVTVNVS
jgi:hypothetical protein